MTSPEDLLKMLSVNDRPGMGDHVRFTILPEATGTVTHKAGGGDKFGVVLDGTGQTVYVDPTQIERIK